MAEAIEFFFDFVSPTSYLAYEKLKGVVGRTGAEVRFRPMLLAAVFQATGNDTPARIPAKLSYYRVDMQRVADRGGFRFKMNPHFPFRSLRLLRGALVALEQGSFPAYGDAVFRATWADGLNMEDDAVADEVISRAGLDAELLGCRVTEPAIKEALKANTREAVGRGAFGAPTFFVGPEMFFGQDRLDWVERAVSGGAAAKDAPKDET